MKKPGLTHEQHKRLGAELYEMKIQLQRISIYLGSNYPFYKLRKIKIDKAIEDIDELRSECENLLFQDQYQGDDYDEAQRLFKLYYPGQTFEEGKIIPLSRGKGGPSRRAKSIGTR
ncbi:MAG: hypothetical protein QG610_636 [Euryarchaeota archaeon]|nr:hypothetical protein [Euryarchaeota archaeon]